MRCSRLFLLSFLLWLISSASLFAQSPLEYSLTLKNPTAHLLQVELAVQASGKSMDFSLPAWAPGSYVIANYAKYVQEFSARDASGKTLAWDKIDKQTWHVSGYAAPQKLTISYRIYAATLSDAHGGNRDRIEVDDFRRRYIYGREALPLEEYLSYAGIAAETTSDTNAAYLGLGIRDEQDQVTISSLTPNSPAMQAGLDAGDKLIAVNNEEVTSDNWQDLLHKYKPGTAITLLISRRGQVKSIIATLGKQPALDFALSINDDAAVEATQLRDKWWESSIKQ